MSAVSDAIAAVKASADAAVARLQSQVTTLQGQVESLQAQVADPADLKSLAELKAELDGVSPAPGPPSP